MKAQNQQMAKGAPNVALQVFAIFVACLTVILLGAGALVTSNEAGDSVPDWPLSFGRWLLSSDQFVHNVRYEYSHRVLAGMVGIATFALAVWVWACDRRVWMRRLAALAFAGVVAQAAIGGVRVLFPDHKALIAIPHALVAQSFFGLIVALAVFTSRSWWQAREVRSEAAGIPLRRLTGLAVAAVLVQLVLGAGFRHQAFGIIPHIIGAILVTVVLTMTVVAVLVRHGEDPYLRRPAVTVGALLLAQLALGVSAYLARLASKGDPQPLEPMVSLTVAHLVVGALVLATLVVLTLRLYQTLAGRAVTGSPSKVTSSTRRATA